MDDKFFKLGTLVVYSIIVPGLIVTSLYYCTIDISNQSFKIDALYLSLLWGIISNTFGHFTGVLFRKWNKKYNGIPFENIYLKSYRLDKKNSSLVRKDGEFWFSIYTLYWNTASGILLLLVFKFSVEKHFDIIVISLLLLLVIVLIFLSIDVLDSINILRKDLFPKLSLDYHFSKSYFCILNSHILIDYQLYCLRMM